MKSEPNYKLAALTNLHTLNYWSEDLLKPDVFGDVLRVFTDREKEIIGMFVQGLTRNEITRLLKIDKTTLYNYVSIIKFVYRNGDRPMWDSERRMKREIFKVDGNNSDSIE